MNSDWLKKCLELQTAGDDRRALDVMFDAIDNACWTCDPKGDGTGDFGPLDESFEAIDISGLNTTLLVGLLTITLPLWKRPSRQELAYRIKQRLLELMPRKDFDRLTGLHIPND